MPYNVTINSLNDPAFAARNAQGTGLSFFSIQGLEGSGGSDQDNDPATPSQPGGTIQNYYQDNKKMIWWMLGGLLLSYLLFHRGRG